MKEVILHQSNSKILNIHDASNYNKEQPIDYLSTIQVEVHFKSRIISKKDIRPDVKKSSGI